MKKINLTLLAMLMAFASFAWVPGAITGSLTTCAGWTTTLSDTTTGGSWSVGTTGVATISSGGVLTGIMAGTTGVTYTTSGGTATAVVTINATPSPITGVLSICVGQTTTLADATGGGVWTSSAPAIASVSMAGIVTGIAAGTTNITYSLPTGCITTTVVTVNPAPPGITGSASVCTGYTTTLMDGAGGGIWSSSNLAIATVGSASGIVTGVGAGVANITYTIASACFTTITVTVGLTAAPITGATAICTGSTTTLSDATGSGTWLSTNTAVATVGSGTGIVLGGTPGTSVISYTVSGGCAASTIVTVNTGVAAIGGTPMTCAGSTTTLTDGIPGGTWSSSNTLIAVVGPTTGVVTGISAGTAMITYALGSGCMTTVVFTVNPLPGAITTPGSLCLGSTDTLVGYAPPGYWGGISVTTIDTTTGTALITGTSVGVETITYFSTGTGCSPTTTVTVNAAPLAITGTLEVCAANTTTLADAAAGGIWSTPSTAIAVSSASGVVTGVTAGTAEVSYSLPTGCAATAVVTVDPLPTASLASPTVCIGGSDPVLTSPMGCTFSSSAPSIAAIFSGSAVIGVAAGTATIFVVSPLGCMAVPGLVVTVNVAPAITATATSAGCGGNYNLTGSGGVSYSWTPATGSCATCATDVVNPSSATTYTVTGTDASGCTNTTTVTVTANRISGYISATTVATDTFKVWLIQFNPSDSSLTGLDSTYTCMDSGIPYYEFDGKAAGNYMVKAKLLSSVAGVSGYIPTYGLSTAHWDTAMTITHTSATDTQHINMIYGTVPAGPGFIGGLIVSGAGKGTSLDVPVVGMLVYLKDASNNILTYTYTDATGAYSFSGLGFGSYIVYPVDYHYTTIPSWTITLTAASFTVSNISFKEHTTMRLINMYSEQVPVLSASNFNFFPNPASGFLQLMWNDLAPGNTTITISDVMGREVYRSALEINTASGTKKLDLSSLKNGIYFISARAEHLDYSSKLLIQK